MNKAKRKCIVTGGSGSIGADIVKYLCNKNYKVYFTYNKNEKKARNLCEEFGAVSHKLNGNSPTKCVESLPRDFSCIINCAAVNLYSPIVENISASTMTKSYNTNVILPMKMIQHCLPFMKEKKWGRIINISSIFGISGIEENLPYVVSKFAVQGLTRALAHDLGNTGITVNSIAPGPVDSDLLKRVAIREGCNVKEYFRDRASEIPTKRLVSVRAISSTVNFLLSNDASDINGSTIVVDGGILA